MAQALPRLGSNVARSRHWESVVDELKARAMAITKEFQLGMQARVQTLRAQEEKKRRGASNWAPSLPENSVLFTGFQDKAPPQGMRHRPHTAAAPAAAAAPTSQPSTAFPTDSYSATQMTARRSNRTRATEAEAVRETATVTTCVPSLTPATQPAFHMTPHR